MIRSEKWNEKAASQQEDGVDQVQLKSFSQIKDELTVNSDTNVILRGNRIVIPTSLQ